MTTLDGLLLSKKIIVTCGTGGVGKTTLSAALAVRAAMLGKNVAVITIDPAKRLVTSLGLRALGDQPEELTHLVPGAKGRIFALMPDTRATFQSMIRAAAPDAETADKILKNAIFDTMAREYSGANEYMAVERLQNLVESGEFQLVILDTPPARNTVAFFEAPEVLIRFFEDRMIRWMVAPDNKILGFGIKKALGVLEGLTGKGFVRDLFEFAGGLYSLKTKLHANLKRAASILKSPDVAFLWVNAPNPESLKDAEQLIEKIRNSRFEITGVVLNRTLSYLQPHPGEHPALVWVRALKKREARIVQEFQTRFGKTIPILAQVPELVRDVHGMDDLIELAQRLGDRPQ